MNGEGKLKDQKRELEKLCKPKCVKHFFQYQGCVMRLMEDPGEDKHCTGQYFDYWKCIDNCVALDLFKELK